MRMRRSRVPRMLPRIAPSVEGEMPWEAPATAVGMVEVEVEVEVEDDEADRVEEMDDGGGVIEELAVVVVGIADVVGIEIVDGGGVKPPYVHTPSVPSGMLGPKYVNGNRKISEDVETLPSRRVMTVVDRVSHEGSSWVGCAIT